MYPNPNIDAFIEAKSIEYAGILTAFRRLILSQLPDGALETIKYRAPFYVYRHPLCYLSVDKKGAYVGFCYGRLLHDPDNLLSGLELDFVRHYRVTKADEINEEQLVIWIHESLILAKERSPFSKK